MFYFSYGSFMIFVCTHPVVVTESILFSSVGNCINYMPNVINYHNFFSIKYIRNKKKNYPSNYFSLIMVFKVFTPNIFHWNFTISSSVIELTTYQILCSSVKYFLTYRANRQTDRQTHRLTDGQTDSRTDRQTDGNKRPYFS